MKRRPLASCLLSVLLLSLWLASSSALGAGLLSFTFDDGLVSVSTDALPILSSYGFTGTAAIPTTGQGEGSESMSIDQIRGLRDAGWEIASHSMNHVEPFDIPLTYDQEVVTNWTKTNGQAHLFQMANPFGGVAVILQDGQPLVQETGVEYADYTEGSFYLETTTNTLYVHPLGDINPNTVEMRTGSLQRELEYSKKQLEEWGFDVVSYVTPFNDWSTVFANQAKPYYRLVADGLGTANDPDNLNPYWLGRISIDSSKTVAEVTSMIQEEVLDNGRWVILCMHGLNGNGYEPWTSEKLSALAAWVKDQGIEVVTLREGLDAVQPPPPVDPLVNAITPPVNTVARPGDALSPFTSTLTNQTQGTLACSYDEFYRDATGQLVKVNTVPGLSLDSNATRTEVKTFAVPAGLAPGSYTYVMRVYDQDGKQADEDGFDFTVVPANTPSHRITASAGSGGVVTPTGTVSVIHGGSQLCTITPNQGYVVAELTIDGEGGEVLEGRTSYLFTNVTADHTLTASFVRAVQTYAVTASAGPGGAIAPIGTTNVPANTDQAYTITPDPGFIVTDVLVDGVSIGARTTYTFANVTSRHAIRASFAPSSYTITAGSGSGGAISPAGTATVAWGESRSYTITPAAGYAIADVLVDNVSVGPVSTYSFKTITSNHKISAVFALKIYRITASAGQGGAISPSGTTNVLHGSGQTYTITPNPGYAVSDVAVDGQSMGPRFSYAFTNVTSEHAIEASFGRSSCTITASAGPGGTISPAGAVTASYGDSLNFSIAPSPGYTVADVTVDGVSVGAHSSYTFSNLTSGHALNASFAPVSTTISPSTGSTWAGQEVSFSNKTNVSGATSVIWDFGDGSTPVQRAVSAPVTHAFSGVGTYTVTCTLADASGSHLDTSSTAVTITMGRTAPSPVQGDHDVVVALTSESFTDLAAGELRSRYGIADATVQPLRPASAFTATTSKVSAFAAFRFPVLGVDLEVAKLRLFKLKADGTNIPYSYGSSADLDVDGAWWITDNDNYDIPMSSTLAAGRTYYVNFVIRDGGPFDLDPTPGVISDPISLARSDAALQLADSHQSPSSSGGSSGGGGGGCTYDPANGVALEILTLLAAVAANLALRRRR